MTTTNRFENLRKIINPRNLLIVFCLLLLIAPVFSYEYTQDIGTIDSTDFGAYIENWPPDTSMKYRYYNVTLPFLTDEWRITGNVYWSSSATSDRGELRLMLHDSITPKSLGFTDTLFDTPKLYDTGSSYPTMADYWANWSHAAVNTHTVPFEIISNSSGRFLTIDGNLCWYYATQYNISRFFFYELRTDSYNDYTKYFTDILIEYEDNEPDYEVELTATGTFCYGHEISFNLSETTAQTYGMYDISLYLNGDPVSKYSEVNFGTGPLLWSKTLEPGNWAALGWWVGGDEELTTWLNFTINSTCDASTYSGTINESYSPGGVTVYDWEWNAYDYLNNLEPWDVPTFDNGNGTSLIDYMYSEGFINESEYNTLYNIVVIQAAANSNLTNTTMQYTYGVLTPFIMINDSISTIRADVNSSYSVLNDAISPITTIFTWIFQMIPIAIIDLMSVMLVFDAVRVILAGRKN